MYHFSVRQKTGFLAASIQKEIFDRDAKEMTDQDAVVHDYLRIHLVKHDNDWRVVVTHHPPEINYRII